MPGQSTYEAEVVVIGGGLAGMVTALELLDGGKRVVMLDAASRDRFGGLAILSFGGMFFVDSPEQRKGGIKDSVDLAIGFATASSTPTTSGHTAGQRPTSTAAPKRSAAGLPNAT